MGECRWPPCSFSWDAQWFNESQDLKHGGQAGGARLWWMSPDASHWARTRWSQVLWDPASPAGYTCLPGGMLLCAVIQVWCWLHRLYLSTCPLHLWFLVFSKEQMRTEEMKANGQIIHVKGFPGSHIDPGFLEQSTLLPSSRVSAHSFPFAWKPLPFFLSQARAHNYPLRFNPNVIPSRSLCWCLTPLGQIPQNTLHCPYCDFSE